MIRPATSARGSACVTSPRALWFLWPLFGWGIAIVIHAASVFGGEKLWGKEWEERKIKELVEKDK